MISHSPAACVYHPARTMSLLHGVEFDEARAEMAVAMPELALGGIPAHIVSEFVCLPKDVISEIEDYSTRDMPPWDAEMACEDLESAHEGFLANGCVLVDVEAIQIQAVEGGTPFADLVPQFISSYIHFGRSGPPSPWHGMRIEGCYLDFCPDDCAMSLTFACSSPFAARMGEVPTSVGLLHQARCIQVSVDCRQSVDRAVAAAETDRGARNASAWSGHVGGAVRVLASALRHLADAPSGMRFDYPVGAPRDLADKVSGGTDEEAADAAGILLANGFMAVVFYGESLVAEPLAPA